MLRRIGYTAMPAILTADHCEYSMQLFGKKKSPRLVVGHANVQRVNRAVLVDDLPGNLTDAADVPLNVLWMTPSDGWLLRIAPWCGDPGDTGLARALEALCQEGVHCEPPRLDT
jgi:hypothetical protein